MSKSSEQIMTSFCFYRDVQHVHDIAQHDMKEAHNMRLFIQSLHDANYQHRLEYVFSKIYTET